MGRARTGQQWLDDREPTLSVVLEEAAHVLQSVQGRFAEEDFRIMIAKREIEVRECLIANREALGIPMEEDSVTRRQLEEYRAELARLQERWR